MIGHVLVVDDDPSMRELLQLELAETGMSVSVASDANSGLRALDELDIDVVLSDLRMPGASGTDLCRDIVRTRPDVPVVIMTGFGSIEKAIAAIRAGAYDFITKPFDPEAMSVVLKRAIEHRRMSDEVRRLRRVCMNQPGFEDLIGTSPVMQRVYTMIDRVAPSDSSILLAGESGTGKELLAHAIHRRSTRASGPFIAVNCAAVPEQLLESELFGHAKGAFTDARQHRLGLVRQAHHGTLFLDEVGEMSSSVQPKLLRALQERRIRPVGSDEEIEVDVRLVTATNVDMRSAINDKRFRADLYYRLAVVTVDVPPLRERGEDILLIAEHFLEQGAARSGRSLRLSSAACEALMAYSWPGNVRELGNVVEHAMALCPSDVIGPEHLPAGLDAHPTASDESSSRVESDPPLLSLGEIERRHIIRVLEAVGGNKSRAARILGIDRKTLHTRLQRYDVD